MIVSFISNTQLSNIPLLVGGDVLIHCGDFYSEGEEDPNLDKLNEWFSWQQYRYKFFVPGEADVPVLRDHASGGGKLTEATLLNGRFVEVEGLKIYGTPFLSWKQNERFGLQTADDAVAAAEAIPEGLDILATHRPPFGVLDESVRGEYKGCLFLGTRIDEARPWLHVFGHDTGSNGYKRYASTHCYNVAQNYDAYTFPMPLTMEVQPQGTQPCF